ncbi:tyrosine-type recombinase/integrase [Nocardia asiatica]|uniref:tyrosine-type recombinase/integrase n=1 Tax=Nocardia asiatica TaxID=209252 RepID=UPI003EE1D535
MKLPIGLQREIRYALHRHAGTARRTHWNAAGIQSVVDRLAAAEAQSLIDPIIDEIAAAPDIPRTERRIWTHLPTAARTLVVSAEAAKAAGWFDPVLIGAPPFPDSQGSGVRRKPWRLNAIRQRWLRDLLWDHLSDRALGPTGRRPTSGRIQLAVNGISLLSEILYQNRQDHGIDPHKLGKKDADMVKATWDLWFQERIPLSTSSGSNPPRFLTEVTRRSYMASIKRVLKESRERGRGTQDLDTFILTLPEYPQPTRNPRPRPLSDEEFQLLVSPANLRALDDADTGNVGFSDIWITHAFQGGRISETRKLRLGCVGLIGAAQPYIWRDIGKVGVIDYGLPCYLPVYQRLLRRQEITRGKLRARYRDELQRLDDRGRQQLEATWDREMPLFPGLQRNPDLKLEVSSSTFHVAWTTWLQNLGLKVTTHQTRATLATSLLNNGAPPALVRQLLGHFSEETLAHYANYSNDLMTRHLQQVWVSGPGMNKPGTVLLRPTALKVDNPASAAARIDLTVVPVEHGLCRYGPVVGGSRCPWEKNCSDGPEGPCEHFVLTGADLAYWERKRDAAVHFAEGAPTDETRDYILSQWEPWESVLAGLREALDEHGLLEAAQKLDLRTPVHDYFDPLFSTGWPMSQLNTATRTPDNYTRQQETKSL